MSNILFTSISVVFSILVLGFLRTKSNSKKYPPSPPSHLFVGHTFRIPLEKPWLYYERLCKTYGPIVRLSLAGDNVLILNDAEDAKELLIRRSDNYSSRKHLIYAGKHQSKDKRLIHLNYGEELRKQRAIFHTIFQPRFTGSHEALQDRESLRLLLGALERPNEMWTHSKKYAGSIVYLLTYGKDLCKDDRDNDLSAILECVNNFIRDCMPGANLVDTFPMLDCLPDFLAPWRKEALSKHLAEMKIFQRLLLEVKERKRALGNSLDCLASQIWDHAGQHQLDLVSMSYLASTAVEAGTDTTTATILFFFAATVCYPDAFLRAQREVDSVVGADGSTMPTFANMKDMPYCFAYTKEVLRWIPVAPTAFPHRSDRDDEDEKRYPEASKFLPERYLENATEALSWSDLAEGHYGFGFGRRSCPGKYIAVQTIWIAFVRMIWGFNITYARDESGKPIPVDPEDCVSALTTRPNEFPMEISPRSTTHEETIRRAYEAAFS